MFIRLLESSKIKTNISVSEKKALEMSKVSLFENTYSEFNIRSDKKLVRML